MPDTFPELDPYLPGRQPTLPSTSQAASTWLTEEMDRQRDRELRQTILNSPPPDQVARTTKLARDAGAPPGMVEGSEDDVQAALNAGKFADLARAHPAIGHFAANNPRGAAAAQDDHESLGVLGTAWDFLKNTPGRFTVAGGLRFGQALGDAYNTLDEWKDIALSPLYSVLGDVAQVPGLGLLDPQKYLEQQRQRRSGSSALLRSTADAASARFRGGNPVSEGLLTGIETVPQTVAAVLTRNPEAAASALGGLVGGSSYQEARRQGLGPAQAFGSGFTQGAIEAATEVMPAGTLVDLIAKKLPFGKAFVKELGQEMVGENVATALQDFSDWAYLPENRNKTLGDYIRARPEAALSTSLAVVGGTSATTVGIKASQRAAETTAKVAGKLSDVAQARREGAFIDKAAKAAEGSKLRQRDPEAFRDLVRHQAEDAGATHMFVPSEAVREYRQSDSYDLSEDPFVHYDSGESEAGGDLVVPIQDALTDLVGTKAWDAVKDHVRLTPGGMSSIEAQEFQDKLDEVMQKLSDETAAREASDKKAQTAREQIVDKVAEMFGVSFTSPAARNIAELVAQRMQTRAARLGQELSPAALEGFEVRQDSGETPEGARALDQSPLGSLLAGLALMTASPAGGSSTPGATTTEQEAPASAPWQQRYALPDWQAKLTILSPTQERQFQKWARETKAPITDDYDMRGYWLHDRAQGTQINANDGLPHFTDRWKTPLHKSFSGESVYANPKSSPPRWNEKDQLVASDGTVLFDERAQPRELQHVDPSGPRGRIIFDQNRRIIELFQSRNLSTPLHELSHMWLEELRFDAEQADAPEQLKADWETVKAYFSKNGHPIGEDGQIPTEAHELWARSGERYFMEGKAPTSGLVRIFETFRAWLTGIYKTVQQLRAPISPEIREVFDRMLATDQEIEAVRERQGIEALFKDAADAGMSEAEFSAYQRQVDVARSDAHAKLIDKTMKAMRARETERYREARKVVRAEEQERIDNSPVFKALAAIKEQRLDKQWIADEFGLDALDLLPVRVPPLYREGGTHPDTVAEQVDYSSGKDMIEALIGAERAHRQAREGGDQRSMRERAIETATDAEMNRRYGDPLNDGSIEREALAAVHSDMQGEVIASELRVLSRKTGSRPTPYAIAKEWARGHIRSGTVAERASPGAIQRYARNAAKAGRAAEQAVLKQDADETFRQKQFQMLNNALLSEAKAAADEVDAAVKRMDKIARATTRKSVDQDYLEQAQALLEAVDLRQRSQISIDRQGKWEAWANAREAEGYDIVVPPSFEATINKTNWTRLSVENLLVLDEAIKQVMHLGRLKQSLTDNQEQREWDAIFAEAQGNGDNIKGPPPAGLDDQGWWDGLKSRIMGGDAALLKLETVFDWLDGGNPNGVFNRIAFRPIADAQAREQDMLKDYHGRIKALFEALPAKVVDRWSNKVSLPFTDPFTGKPVTFSRQKLIAMALNIGNEGNLQRLSDGYGWNAAAIENHLVSELTAEEWQFVQGVWDNIETLWPEIEAMERRVNGIAPEKVEARSFQTPHGTMRGGYYPAIYDSRLDLKTEERRGKETDLFESAYTRATTRSSATKDRAEAVKRPILLDLGVINRHLGEVVHDITHREAVMQAHKFLTNARVAGTVDRALGPEIRQAFRPWVKFVANSWAMERAGNEGFGQWIGKLRANATAVGLGLRGTTMVTQLAGYSNSTEIIGEKWMAVGLAKFSAHPVEAFRFVAERSGEVRHRMDTLDRDIRTELARIAAKNPLSKAAAHLDDAKVFMFHGIGLMDRAVVVPTWIGAYNKALSEGMTETDAAYSADKAVRASQGAGAPKDLAAIQRGTGKWGEALKLFTMFYSYFSAYYQRQRTLARDVRGVDTRRPRNVPRLAARAFWLLIVPPLLTEILKAPLGAGGPDDDEAWLQWISRKLIANALGPIPLARDVFEPAWNKAIKGKFYSPSISPLQRAYDSITNTAGDAGKIWRGEDTKRATRDVLETAGYVTGLVPGQVAAATQFLVDVSEGDADPQTFGDWLEGLSSGKIKQP